MTIDAVARVAHFRKTLGVAAAGLFFAAPLSAGVIVFQNGDRIAGDGADSRLQDRGQRRQAA